MTGKRIKAFALALVMAISFLGIFSGKITFYSSEYEKAVALMKAKAVSAVSSSAFSADSTSITPGEPLDKALLENLEIPDSALSDITALQYYHETDSYAYGITAEGSEVFALRKANGQKYDMLSGAGKAVIRNSSKTNLITSGAVETFTEGADENGNKTLTVSYALSGNAVTEYENAVTAGAEMTAPSVTAVYTFYEDSVGIKVSAEAESENYIFDSSKSYLGRTYIQGYKASNERVKVNSKWIYPDNLDEPYQDFESLAYIYSSDGVHKMYTFRRGDDLAKYYATDELRGTSFGMSFEDGNTLNASCEYTLAFVDSESEEQNADYLGLFRSRNDDLAVGIAVAEENSERSTIFEGNTAKLNINVTNLRNAETTFSLRYDIRNYYGDVVDAGLFIDNTLEKNSEANRLITVSGKYGMYYLNLYVISENTEYKECYPFALLEEYDYTYNETSPFGISTVTSYIGAEAKTGEDASAFVQDYSQVKDLANLSAKIGISNARTSASVTKPKYVEYMQELGITRFIAQQNATFESLYRESLEKLKPSEPEEPTAPTAPEEPAKPLESEFGTTEDYESALSEYETQYQEYLSLLEAYEAEYEQYLADCEAYEQKYDEYINSDEYKAYLEQYEAYKIAFAERVKASADAAAEYAEAIEYGNEMNIYTLRDNDAYGVDSLYDLFYEDTFLPSYSYVTENYSGLEYIPTSFSAAESGWISRLADTTKGNAIWDRFNICSIHVYGQPWMPDSYGAQKGGSNNLWNIEDAMIRIENACKTYGDKEVYVTEIGYSTPPESSTSVNLRTQADYTARIGAICLGHGVDVVQYYCMSDRTSHYSGFNNTNGEWNFGLFYEADYFDVIKPKPAGIAYANMTRQLESYVHNSGKIDFYDAGNLEDGTYSYNVAGVRAFRFETELYGEVVMAYSNSEVLSNGKKNAVGASNMRTANLTWNTKWTKTERTEFTATADTVRVVDIMGNETVYTPDENGKVTIALTGSPVYIYGV